VTMERMSDRPDRHRVILLNKHDSNSEVYSKQMLFYVSLQGNVTCLVLNNQNLRNLLSLKIRVILCNTDSLTVSDTNNEYYVISTRCWYSEV
jgi:hypothetical protein